MKRTTLKIFIILIFAFLCCRYFDFSTNEIINYSFILSASIDIMAVALAVTAIFFTVIDRYKDKQENPTQIESLCFPILKEMCENVLGILFTVILMVVISIFESLLVTFTFPTCMGKFSIPNFIYLAGFLFILLILFDITKSVLKLTSGLFISNADTDSNNNDKYISFLKICKKLDAKHFNELLEYTKFLVVKQTMEKDQEK